MLWFLTWKLENFDFIGDDSKRLHVLPDHQAETCLSFNPKGGMKQNESSLFNLSPSFFPSLITAYSSLRSSQSPEQRIRYQILEQLPDLKALNPLAS